MEEMVCLELLAHQAYKAKMERQERMPTISTKLTAATPNGHLEVLAGPTSVVV